MSKYEQYVQNIKRGHRSGLKKQSLKVEGNKCQFYQRANQRMTWKVRLIMSLSVE